jgi:cyanate lyase
MTDSILSKKDVAAQVRRAMTHKGMTWARLAQEIDKPEVWTASALLGQQPMPREAAEKAATLLDLSEDAVDALIEEPYRGAGVQEIPSDPTVYRFYEALAVYGPALKELLHEKFGDGIMSAINFKISLDKKEEDGEQRVIVTFDGKFLDYKW